MGKDAESIAEHEKAASLEPVPLVIGQLGYQYAISGRREQAQKVLAELIELSRKSYVAPYRLATVYLGLGEKEQALRCWRRPMKNIPVTSCPSRAILSGLRFVPSRALSHC
jgi:Tfp pilus assembly protein PilF